MDTAYLNIQDYLKTDLNGPGLSNDIDFAPDIRSRHLGDEIQHRVELSIKSMKNNRQNVNKFGIYKLN